MSRSGLVRYNEAKVYRLQQDHIDTSLNVLNTIQVRKRIFQIKSPMYVYVLNS